MGPEIMQFEEGTPAQVIDAPQHARTQQFLRQVGDR